MTRSLRSLGNETALLTASGLLLGGLALVAFSCGTDDRNPDLPEQGEGRLGTDDSPADPPEEPGDGQSEGEQPTDDDAQPGGSASEDPNTDLPLDGNDPVDGMGGDEPPSTDPGAPAAALQPNCQPSEGAVPNLALTAVATDLNQPVFVTGVPGDDSRLFILEKAGVIRLLDGEQLRAEPFLDVSGQVANQGERGLLGLAFHPNYADNGLFYIHYSANGVPGVDTGDGIVSEFSLAADTQTAADPSSERRLLSVGQPQGNHNGGMITFGPDGFLYVGLGDGGGANDQHGPIGNGQALDTLLGKLLRIDVDGRDVNDAYSIPPQNLAAQTGQEALPEIWAYGLRNPWRFSFDACNGDLFIGDVGQGALEEIDYLPADTAAGANFGWRVMEGTECGPQGANCSSDGLVLPIDEYGRGDGVSVTGGYVYRGSRIPGLRGYYVYADYGSANFFLFRVEDGQAADRRMLSLGDVQSISSFGQDNAGEIYVTSLSQGTVYRLDQN